ncbi:MAG TPA: insulinase family protein [Geminicoccus sp.]|uniref:M16 family metallopeptidase n=1 Tax=Geminicoccus sp. TaxID=2024832 RepID=UPI002B82794A|nr:insulinase family protein [Geminicoccus sp.]HWL68727.1 insulinase family protein [Geminicoccus sp.]
MTLANYLDRLGSAMRLLALALLLLPAVSAAAEEPWPRTAQAPLVPDPAVTWGRLENGLRYAIIPNRTPPGRVSLRLLIEAGSLMERDDQRGLAHFLEHMAFKGSENVPPGEFVRYLQRQGLSFGADTNARTGFDSTVYQLELPGNGEELLDSGLMILSEVAGRLTFPPDGIDSERGVILSEKRLRNTPGARSADTLLAFMLDGTLYPERNPIGTDEVIRQATQADFQRFYRDFYTPERSVVVVAGDVAPGEVVPLIERHFAGLVQPESPAAPPELGTLAATGTDALHFVDPGLPTVIQLMHAEPALPPADTLERVDRRLVQAMAQLMLSRRLQNLGLTPGAPFSQAGAWTTDMPPVAQISAVTLQTTEADWEKALAAGEQELRRALTFGFSQQEMDEAVAILRSEFRNRAASAATMSSERRAEALISTVEDGEIYTSEAADLELLERTLAGLDPAKLQDSLKAAWGDGTARIMLSGPFPLENGRQRILDAYATSRAVPVEPPAETASVAFGYQDFGQPSGVVEDSRIEDLDIRSIRFGNGVRLDMKPTKLRADTIEVALRFGQGSFSMPAHQPGLDLLASQGFVAGGLGRHDASELTRIFADKQVGVDLTVAETSFVMTGTTTRADLADQLRLMAAFVTDPGYRPDALERFRRQLPDLYRAMDASPAGLLRGPVERFLHGGDPRFGLPDQADAAERTLDELRAWLTPALRRGPMQVVLVGDIEAEAAVRLVDETFGALPERGEGAELAVPSVRMPESGAEPVRFVHHGAADQAMSAVYWPTADGRDLRLKAGLDLLGDILQDRLLDTVRERAGASYSPEVYSDMSITLPDFGYLAALLDVRAEDALQYDAATVAAASGLREGIEADELRRALEPRLAQSDAARQSNRWWAYAVILAMHQFPERLEAARTDRANLESWDAAALQGLAKTYLAPERALRVLIVPATPD